jgi:hypothetical protein
MNLARLTRSLTARRSSLLSRSDVKEFGEIIDAGQAALIIVGQSKLQQAVAKAELKAEKHVGKELGVSAKDVDNAVQEAAREVS